MNERRIVTIDSLCSEMRRTMTPEMQKQVEEHMRAAVLEANANSVMMTDRARKKHDKKRRK